MPPPGQLHSLRRIRHPSLDGPFVLRGLSSLGAYRHDKDASKSDREISLIGRRLEAKRRPHLVAVAHFSAKRLNGPKADRRSKPCREDRGVTGVVTLIPL